MRIQITFRIVMLALLMVTSVFAISQVQPTVSQIDLSSPPIPDVQIHLPPNVAAERLKKRVDPEYPTKALDAQLQGDVILDVLIGKNGKVKNVQVTSGNPVLSHAAVDAVKHWQYEPFSSAGTSVETRTTVTIGFVLSKGPIICPGQNGEMYAFLVNSKAPDMVQSTPDNSPQRVFQVGEHVKAPRPLYTPDPEYTESARSARRQGTAVMQAIVTPEGKVARIRMVKVIGYGLDKRAVDCLCQWKFDPAIKDSQPVPVQISVEVSFRLY